MINYIRAELYRSFKRLYFWNLVGIISILALLVNTFVVVPNANFELLLIMGIQMLSVPVFLVFMIIDMVTGEEIKNLTLKNVVAFGISRNKLVLSKIIVTVILSFIAAIIILTVFLGSGAMLFGVKDVPLDLFKDFLLRLLAAIPLWIGAISVGTMMSFIFTNYTLCGFVYAGAFVVIGPILKLLSTFVSDKFIYIYNILITTQLKSLSAQTVTNNDLISAVITGIIYSVVFIILSMMCLSKKEVK